MKDSLGTHQNLADGITAWRSWAKNGQPSCLEPAELSLLIDILGKALALANQARDHLDRGIDSQPSEAQVRAIEQALREHPKLDQAIREGASGLMKIGVHASGCALLCARSVQRLLSRPADQDSSGQGPASIPCPCGERIELAWVQPQQGADGAPARTATLFELRASTLSRILALAKVWMRPPKLGRVEKWRVEFQYHLSPRLEWARSPSAADLFDGLDCWARERFDWAVPESDSCLSMFSCKSSGADALRLRGYCAIAQGRAPCPEAAEDRESVRQWRLRATWAEKFAARNFCDRFKLPRLDEAWHGRAKPHLPQPAPPAQSLAAYIPERPAHTQAWALP